MRKIAIVGAGQAGLQLALGLRAHDYDVTVVTNRSARDLREGRVMSTQCMFADALATERRLGIDFWESEAPQIEGFHVTVVGPDGGKAVEWEARLDDPAQSVDQRIKFSRWLEEFERRGGTLRIADAGLADLDALADGHDLVLVAAGKGDIAALFERDPERSPYDAPQRALAVAYVHGMRPRESFVAVGVSVIPTAGELFQMPALTKSGPCDILFFEAVPGGPLDAFGGIRDPHEHLARTKELLEAFLPWEAERARDARLTDEQGTLAGRFPPTVRRPVGTLPSGRPVLGVADAVVLNDPITGQGSNSAAKCADVYLRAIVERGGEPFDAEWMEATFARFWDYAQWVTRWTNMFLAPPPPHALQLLGAPMEVPGVGRWIANGFNRPPSLFPAWEDPQAAERLIAEQAGAPA